MSSSKKRSSGNNKLLIILISLALTMLSLAYASVPLYSLFCKVTGFGGTVREFRNYKEGNIGARVMKVRFNADVATGLPLKFSPPEEKIVSLRTGENRLVFYHAENTSNKEIDVIAIYNVTPHKIGKYFNKVACFCFNRQTLSPGEKVVMPVSFFIDPEIEKNKEVDEVRTVTLSYTFFKHN
ncbi:MAG: cytochrome c oxidase assembly protein [Rickettsiaceae bacterium H1]|nr:cytochrome c oxidase assembly protein [Rickettsiaceae bacterium H1]